MSQEKNTTITAANVYAKSNYLIGAKYRSTLLENKLLAVSLLNVQEDSKGLIFAEMKASELRKLFGTTSGGFYKQLDDTAEMMTGKTIGFSDPEKQVFDYIAVVTRAHYENGKFTVEFNHNLKQYITDIQDNFTKLNLEIMLKFKSIYSFRLYELLKSKAYSPKGYVDNNQYIVNMTLSEFKLNLGVVNTQLDSVKRILKNAQNKDKSIFDKAVDASPEKEYTDWKDLKTRVLDKAINEINEKTDLDIVYVTKTSGRGGKVYAIEFKISYKDKKPKVEDVVENVIMDEVDIDDLVDEIRDYCSEVSFKTKEIKRMLEIAYNDIDRIKGAYDILISSKTHIDNPVGFMHRAIEGGWEKHDQFVSPQEKNRIAKDFNNFRQTSYADIDFEEYEKTILSN